MDSKYESSHGHSINNKVEIEISKECVCFYCARRFAPASIVEWTDGGQTAICPHCSIDSVIGDAAPYQLDAAFIAGMAKRWFDF